MLHDRHRITLIDEQWLYSKVYDIIKVVLWAEGDDQEARVAAM